MNPSKPASRVRGYAFYKDPADGMGITVIYRTNGTQKIVKFVDTIHETEDGFTRVKTVKKLELKTLPPDALLIASHPNIRTS